VIWGCRFCQVQVRTKPVQHASVIGSEAGLQQCRSHEQPSLNEKLPCAGKQTTGLAQIGSRNKSQCKASKSQHPDIGYYPASDSAALQKLWPTHSPCKAESDGQAVALRRPRRSPGLIGRRELDVDRYDALIVDRAQSVPMHWGCDRSVQRASMDLSGAEAEVAVRL